MDLRSLVQLTMFVIILSVKDGCREVTRFFQVCFKIFEQIFCFLNTFANMKILNLIVVFRLYRLVAHHDSISRRPVVSSTNVTSM